jgi:tripartite-type tricarboxylate transporter receptor subunit TctC
MYNRFRLLGVALMAAALAAPTTGFAQAYPNKPIHLISPFPAGGGNDAVARIVAIKMGELLKQPIIVENRAGASGNIGAAYVAKSAPDGYTLLFTNNTLVANPAIGKVPFDVLKDFTPVGMAGSTAIGVAVHPSVPATSLPQLIELVRKNPDKYSYASCGSGTTMHLVAEMLKQRANLTMAHIGYKGCGPAIVDGMAGHVPILFNTFPNLRGPAQQGKLRILAIASPKRSALAPDLPTFGEAVPALKGVIGDSWAGIVAPAGVPANIIATLNSELNAAVTSPDTRARLDATATEVQPMTPAELGDIMKSELERWTALVRETGLVVEQ